MASLAGISALISNSASTINGAACRELLGRKVKSKFSFICGLVLFSLSSFAAQAQPVLEGIATTTSGGAQSINLNVPANSVGSGAGDLLVAALGVRGNTATAYPAGWTAVSGHAGFNQAICSSDDEGIACQLSVYWKFASASEPAVNIFLNAGNVSQAAGAVFRYSSTHPTDPIGQVSTQPGSTNNPTAPNLVTSEADVRVIQLMVSDTKGGDFPLPITSEPANAVFNLQSATPITRDSILMGGAEFAEPVSGSSTGTAAWTGGENNWRGSTLTVRPAQTAIIADLSIVKKASPAKVNPGGKITYTIVVKNNGTGAADVSGAVVTDNFPAGLDCEWTCSATAGSSCTASGTGDINDSVDLAAGGRVTYTAICKVGKFDGKKIKNYAKIRAPEGVDDPNGRNNGSGVITTINLPPVAKCKNVTVDANDYCRADASINSGSSDPDGDNPLKIEQSPAGPYPLGTTEVELTITDTLGLRDSCKAKVTVRDVTPPVIACNAPATITATDVPVSFTATAKDNCGATKPVITCVKCSGRKRPAKKRGKKGPCSVSIFGNKLVIDDTGPVGSTIKWEVTAIDDAGNSATKTCSVEVVGPAH